MNKSEKWHCANPACQNEIVVTSNLVNTRNLRCACGFAMKREYEKPMLRKAIGVAANLDELASQFLVGSRKNDSRDQPLTALPPNGLERREDRRRTPRYPFVASAELGENACQARLFVRVTEISMNGCFLDMINPLPVGTEIFVKIFTTEDFFECAATVVYSQPNLGVGLTFHDVSWHFLPSLQKCLLEAMRAAAGEKP